MPPIGSCPTFSMHGSKSMIAKWVISTFPNQINNYFEPFAGRGNVYYRLATTKGYQVTGNIYLNDLYNADWLQTLKDYDGDWSFVPSIVNYEVYEYWKNQPPSIDRMMIEPIVCYHSNRFNIQGSAINDPENKTQYFSPNYAANWKRKLQLTQKLLKCSLISQLDYVDFLSSHQFQSDDLVYCDPPYYEKYDEKKTYPSIKHAEFLDRIRALPCRVAVSNYWNELYVNALADWNVESKVRVSTAKGRQTGHAGGKSEKVEYIWKNF